MIPKSLRTHAGRLAGTVIVLALTFCFGRGASLDASPLAQEPDTTEGTAAVTRVISYQGRLLDPSTGAPKPDGTYTMTFALYNVATGGSALWTETKNVTVSKGLFSTLLGDTAALNLNHFNGQDLWLGVKVGADSEASPRMRIAYNAYALRAVDADKVDGQDASAFAGASHNHDAAYVNDNANEVDNADVPNGALSPAKISGTAWTKAEELNADLLDGQDSSAFAAAGHNHDPDYVNTSGPDSISGNSPDPILTAVQSGTGNAIRGEIPPASTTALDNIAAIRGEAGTSGIAITREHGVRGDSDDGHGVVGTSDTGTGVVGRSNNKQGVSAESVNSYGLYAYSQNSDAIYAAGTIRTNRVAYTTPRTHYVTVGATAFTPGSNVPYFKGSGQGGAYIGQTGSGRMVAPLFLPQGAEIVRFTVFYRDNSSSDMTIGLSRESLTQGFFSDVANITTSGASTNWRSSSTTPSNTVDNTTWSYFVDVYSSNWPGSWDLSIKGALITYTISEAP